jgi:Ni/Co efflux regulator RcnB
MATENQEVTSTPDTSTSGMQQQQLGALKAAHMKAAENLDDWKTQDANRQDGSGAQDRRHEERGLLLREEHWSLGQKVKQMTDLIGNS